MNMTDRWHGIGFACLMFMSTEISVVQFVTAFNVDVRTAVVHVEKHSDGFGHAAEFVEMESNVRLLVAAPRETVSDWRNASGIHYYCNPLINNTCTKHYSKPMDVDDVNRRRLPISGEMQERFGLSLIAVNKSLPLICGPLWSDRRSPNDNYIFNVGRCLLGCCEKIAPYVNESDYMKRGLGGLIRNSAEFGFATAADEEGRIILTAPGYNDGHGEVVLYDTDSKKLFKMETAKHINAIKLYEKDLYLGYAVTIGNFCTENHICFAVSDRKQNGTTFASFGASLSAIDLNGDGWSGLLVGAPLYTSTAKDKHSYDEGRVFVYLSNGEALVNQNNTRSLHPVELCGHQQMFSRFGSAIGSIGDVNKDSFQDVAVGAPMENDGVGAVYIYLGGQQFPKDVSQRISGNELKPPLTSFGYHISKLTTAIDDFQYPAFAVGCPQSSAVVVFRTRPIVNVKINISAVPNPVTRDNSCSDTMPSAVSGCLMVHHDPSVQLMLRVTYDLNTTSFTGSVLPLLNESLPKYSEEEVKFLYTCSEGQKCQADLHLTGNLIHESSESVQSYNIVNQTKKVAIHLLLNNIFETTFSINLTVNVTGQIEFLSSSSMNTSHHFQCELQARFSSGYQLFCPIWLTVYWNIPLAVALYFRADTVPAERDNRYVTFDITALPDNVEDEENLINNNLKLVSEMKISANLSVNGYSKPLILQVNAKTKNDLLLAHNLLLTNHGPSFLPSTNVTLNVPFRDKAGKHLVDHLKVTITNSEGDLKECHVISHYKDGLVESVSKATIAMTPGTDITTDAVEVDLDPEVESNRRRRRSQKKNTEFVNHTSGRTKVLSCESYVCQVLTCPVSVLQKGDYALVNISFSVLNAQLFKEKNDYKLIFETSVSVAQPNHPLFIPWREPYLQSTIRTEIYSLSSKGEINIWIVVGGVLAGVFLIMIIVVIAWKFGFFRRKDFEKLKQERRERKLHMKEKSKVRDSKLHTS